MTTKDELLDTDRGVWNVQTETSSYIIDMDKRRSMRIPNTGAGIHPDHAENRIVIVTKLHKDGEWFDFATLEQCMVGELMYILESSSLGMRRSTIVRKIIQVHPND